MEPKQRLQMLRKKKRLAELRSKRDVAPKKDLNAAVEEKMQRFQASLGDTNKPSELQSAASGAAQGASLGFADEIAGGVEALGSTVGVRGAGGGFDDIRLETDEEDQESLSDIYSSRRDQRRGEEAIAAKANPMAYIAGGIAGSAALPGGSIPALAAQGAAMGLGMSEADNLEDLAKDTVGGAALGFTGGAFMKGAGKLVDATGLKDFAGRQMVAAMKPSDRAQAELRKLGIEASTGRKILDEGVGWNPFRSNKRISEHLGEARSKVGKQIDDLFIKADGTEGVITSKKLEGFLSKRADELMEDPGTVGIAKGLKELAKDVKTAKRKVFAPSQVRAFRQKLDDRLYKDGKLPLGDSQKIDVLQEGRDVLSKVETDQVGALAGAKSDLNKNYLNTAKADDIATRAADKGVTNNMFGLTSNIANIAGVGGFATTGDPTYLALSGGREFLRRYGRQLMGFTANNVGKILQHSKFGPILQEAVERGGNAPAAQHYLLQQSDPEYRKLFEDDKKD